MRKKKINIKAIMPKPSKSSPKNRWSGNVTRESNALDLEEGVFTWEDPQRIALSLKKSAERSTRRKAPPFRSAMSMLVFYINRAGRNLGVDQLRILEEAKEELRKLYQKSRPK
jgi:Protein of unknown function (DUF3175)